MILKLTRVQIRKLKAFITSLKCSSTAIHIVQCWGQMRENCHLFESHQSCVLSASLIQAHAELRWFHSFVLSLDRNPLGSEFCENIIESAECIKSKRIAKKKPFSAQIIKDILDTYNKEDASLKDVRIAALCSLAFAGFFRYNELCNIAANHVEFVYEIAWFLGVFGINTGS